MEAITKQIIPIVLSGRALKSLRDSGHNLPTAIGEVVDNSIEANANFIHVRLEQKEGRRGKKRIYRIAVADDGEGMAGDTLQLYPQIGFSTRYMSTSNIGKYGVGAKLAALNFGQRMDIWSRTTDSEPWLHVYFDLEETLKEESWGEPVGIKPLNVEPVPDDLRELLPAGSGTLVVWSKVDRLEEGRKAADFNSQRQEVEKELSRMFRYFLGGGIVLTVNGTKLYPMTHYFLWKIHGPIHNCTPIIPRIRRALVWLKRLGSIGRRIRRIFRPISLQMSQSQFRLWGRMLPQLLALKISLYPRELIRKRGMGGDPLAPD